MFVRTIRFADCFSTPVSRVLAPIARGVLFLSEKNVSVRTSCLAADGRYPLLSPDTSSGPVFGLSSPILPTAGGGKIECPELVEGLFLDCARNAQFCNRLWRTKLVRLPDTGFSHYTIE